MAGERPGTSASATATASSVAVRRLRRELDSLRTAGNPQLAVRPSEDNMLEWHFVLHSFPSDTPYQGGFYHGRLIFPPTYPHAPPAILMSTPSGRLETGKRLCLSMSDWHPENWNPAWSVETILVGLLSFFVSDTERGYGSMSATPERRRALAAASAASNARDQQFRELFPEFLGGGDGGEAIAVALVPNNIVTGGAGAGAGSPPLQRAAAAGEEQAAAAAAGRGGGAIGATAAAAGGEEAAGSGARGASGDGDAEGDGFANSAAPAAVADAEQAAPAPAQAEEEEDEPNECWICRDDSTSEPLIHPCACRGSMSGVHASCVEQWIHAHLRNAVNDDPPRCGVCQQPYQGNEHRPGVRELLRQQGINLLHLAPSILCTFGRFLLFLFFLNVTERPGMGMGFEKKPSLWVCIVIIAAFAVIAAYKTALLTVSLPPNRVPPRSPFARRFFVSDCRSILLHLYEVTCVITVVASDYIQGKMPLVFCLPLFIMVLVPLIKTFVVRHQHVRCAPMQCLRGLGFLLLAAFLVPFILLRSLCSVLWLFRMDLMHPLAAGPHFFVAVASVVLGELCKSNIPVVALLGTHVLLSLAGLVELLLVKRWRWREGPLWLFAFEFVWLSTLFLESDTQFPKGLGAPGQRENLVRAVALAWACLFTLLAVGVNYQLVRSHAAQAYRTWQHRNGSFRLQVQAPPPGRRELEQPLHAGVGGGADDADGEEDRPAVQV